MTQDAIESDSMSDAQDQLDSSPLKSNPLSLFPAEVDLPFEELKTQYSITVVVKNLDNRLRNVRVKDPKSAHFQVLLSQPTTKLAPGLEMTFVVVFNGAPECRDYCQNVRVLSEGMELVLPVRMRCLKTAVHTEGSLDLGVLPPDTPVQRSLVLVSTGTKGASFKAEVEGSVPLTISPASGTLGAAGSGQDRQMVTVASTGLELGVISTDLLIHLEGESRPLRIPFGAAVVQPGIKLLTAESEELSGLEFGSLYFGEMKTVQVQVLNQGPLELKVTAQCGKLEDLKMAAQAQVEDVDRVRGDDDEEGTHNLDGFISLARMHATNLQAGSNPFIVHPMLLYVPAFGKQTFSVTFHPQQSSGQSGFQCSVGKQPVGVDYDFMMQLDMGGSSKKMQVPIKGRGTQTGAMLDPICLQFGSISTGAHTDHFATLSNMSNDLPLRFSIDTASHPYFDCRPRSGSVVPKENVMLQIRYHPKALGRHQARMPCKIYSMQGKLIQELGIQMSGSALKVGDRPKLIGGPEKVPEDFQLPSNYVDDDSAGASLMAAQLKKFKRLQLWETEYGSATFPGIQDGHRFAWSKAEHMLIQDHQAQYQSFLKASHRQRKGLCRDPMLESEGLDLGMSKSGLKAPEPSMPVVDEPLWLEDAHRPAQPRTRRLPPEAEILKIPKHSEKPLTDQERLQCSQRLSPQDVARLEVAPSFISFSTVSCLSSNTKYFVISNPLPQPIFVVLVVKQIPTLRKSPVVSQVVPAGATAAFPITLFSRDAKAVHEQLEYIINGCHFFSINVTAEVVPVTLEVSVEDLDFSFSLENWDPHVDRYLALSNPNRFPAQFEWVLSTGVEPTPFSVTPRSGTVPPRSMMESLIRWAPTLDHPTGRHEGQLTLSVTGGCDNLKRVYLSARLPDGNVRFASKVMDLGTVPCGLPQTGTARLKNPSDMEVGFRVLNESQLRCVPEKGRIGPKDSFDIDVTINCIEPGPVKEVLQVEVRGGKTLKLPIKAVCVMPVLEVVEPELDFGRVYQGGMKKIPLTLRNTSAVQAVYRCDLLDRPEFRLRLPKENWDTTEYQGSPLQHSGGDRDDSSVGSRSRRSFTGTDLQDRNSNSGSRYQVQVNPESELKLEIMFSCKSEREHEFELPLCSGVTMAKAPAASPVMVKAIGAKPCLEFSNTRIDFGTCLVVRANETKKPHILDIKLQNSDDKEVDWEFGSFTLDAQEGCRGVFQVEPAGGHLKPGSTARVRLTFTPKDSRAYQSELPVYINGNSLVPHVVLEVHGTGQWPKLAFDTMEVVMPPVPLGLRSERLFLIHNDGYDNLELRYRLPADEKNLPLALHFPEGTLIGLAKEELPVVVSFVSAKPMSFTASIDFLDEEGRRFSIPVSGTTDNCLLTLQPFVDVNEDDVDWIADEGQAISIEAEDGFQLPSAADSLGVEMGCDLPLRILHCLTMKGPFQDLSGQICRTKGKLIVDLIEMLSGQAMPQKLGGVCRGKKETAEQVCKQFDLMLGFLKSYGALLNAIKPEMLLDQESFDLVMDARAERAQSEEDMKAIEDWEKAAEGLDKLNRTCWNSVLMQIMRIFVLARVTHKSLQSVPGLQAEEVPDVRELLNSNVYSASETVLLSWLNIHYRRAFPDEASKRIQRFDTDLRDSRPLIALFLSHWPLLESMRPKIIMQAEADFELTENATVLCRMVEALQLPLQLVPGDIVSAKAQEMMLLVMYLFQVLPQFVPRAVINFTGRLCQQQTRCLELTNPSKRGIAYSARLEGHSDFTLTDTVVRIDPKATMPFQVNCTPTTAVQKESLLVLTSRADASVNAATLVFKLISTVDPRVPLKRIQVEKPLYELLSFEFTVTNPFPGDVDFTISLVHEPAQPENQSSIPTKGKKKASKPPRSPPKAGAAAAAAAATAKQQCPRDAFPDAFGVEKSRVRLKQGGSEKLQAAFLPFTSGTHYCTVQFEDSSFGRIVYELVGEAGLPAPFTEHRLTVPLEKKRHTEAITIPFVNHQLDAAKRLFLDRHPLHRDRNQAARLKKGRDDLLTAVAGHTIQYSVKQSSSLIQASSQVLLVHPQGMHAAGNEADNANMITLSLEPIGTGLYPTRLMLTSAFDLRIVDVELTAQSLGTTYSMDFQCQARQKITQEIPLINSSDKTMNVAAIVAGQEFSGPKEVVVPPAATVQYPLTFKAPWLGDFKGTLELLIPATKEKNTYNLTGHGLDPACEEHLVLECRARSTTVRRLKVPNYSDASVDYAILSSLACVHGPEKLSVGRDSTGQYNLSVTPVRSGSQHGTLTFQAPDGQYVWYSLELHVTEPPEVDTIVVQAPVREAVLVEVPVSNPTDLEVEMLVKYSCDVLLGPRRLLLKPSQTTSFSFYFSPLVEGVAKGSVTLISETLGEFWYGMEMTALPTQPIELPELVAEVGSTVEHRIPISNPLQEHVKPAITSSNSANFTCTLEPAEGLGPLEDGELVVQYMPRSVAAVETGCIVVEHAKAGSWQLMCSGRGDMPRDVGQVEVYAVVGTSSTGTISWTNPFSEVVSVDVSMESEEEPAVLAMTMKQAQGVSVGARGTLHVPIRYTPSRLDTATARVKLQVQGPYPDKLTWDYAVKAVSEADMKSAAIRFKCTARSRLEEEFEVKLVGLQRVDADEVFSHEVIIPERYAALLQGRIRVRPVHTSITCPSQALRYGLVFEPKRMGSGSVELMVNKASGGRWRFELQLQATEPESDGTIVIKAHMETTGSVPVQLYAPGPHPVPFTASFTHDTPLVFDVQPKTGQLLPSPAAVAAAAAAAADGGGDDGEGSGGGEGSGSGAAGEDPAPPPACFVSYTCREMGKTVKGSLLISTPDMLYTYQVVGCMPTYQPPRATDVEARVDARADPDLLRKMGARSTKNLVLKNSHGLRGMAAQRKPS